MSMIATKIEWTILTLGPADPGGPLGPLSPTIGITTGPLVPSLYTYCK